MHSGVRDMPSIIFSHPPLCNVQRGGSDINSDLSKVRKCVCAPFTASFFHICLCVTFIEMRFTLISAVFHKSANINIVLLNACPQYAGQVLVAH